MKTYTLEFGKNNFGAVKAYASRSLALASGNGQLVASDEDDIVRSSYTITQLVTFYNHHNSAQPVKMFKDKTTAAKRLLCLAEAKAELVVPQRTQPTSIAPEEKVSETIAKVKSDKAPKVKAESDGKRGRKSNFNGLKLHSVNVENPRREGTHGHKSMQIIIDNPGISYEDFIAKGGRANDLRWDIEHSNVVAK